MKNSNVVTLKTLPRIVLVNDYHELLNLADDVKNYLGIKINCKELGCNGDYVGLVFQGKLPSKAVINELLKKEKIEFLD
jgi:hypothetical protein